MTQNIVIITDFVTDPTIEAQILGSSVAIVCLNEEDENNYPDIIECASAVLVWHGQITQKTLGRLRNCRAVVRYGAGYDNIDRAEARSHKSDVCNTPDYGVEEVADTACAMILTAIRQVAHYDIHTMTFVECSMWQDC
jgi:lactate dehydrogenase-like 2-hydroxyacid dehydrogenase